MHLGVSEEMRQIETILRQTAGTEDPSLIMGERGVGKEVAAKFVHQISPRADEPFVGVGCAFLAAHCPAINKDLIDSQLFGHERGAFTNARARHHGYVERAHNGILLLDEVGELPL